MPQNLQLLKRRIKTSKNVSQIAKAMEMMSASKIKRAQNTVENNKPYAGKISLLTKQLIQSAGEKYTHPFISGNNSSKKLLIAISPDRGLCGSLNTNLFKKLITLEDKETTLITIGHKVERFAAKLTFDLAATFPMGNTLPRFSNVYDVIRLVNTLYTEGKVGSVEVLYTEFTSFFHQEPIVKKLLPIDISELPEKEEGVSLYEPGIHELLDILLPQYLEVSFYSALLEAYTSEQAARMISMQNAKNNANDIANYLTLQYNKSRQEKITGEILDLSNTQ